VVKAGSVSHQLVQQADLLATFAAILGVSLPDNAGEDSVSFLPVLRGKERPVRLCAVNQSFEGLPAIRRGSWKLIFGPGSGGWSKGDDGQPAQLYNLATDLGETNNLFAGEPRIAAELTSLMEQFVRTGRSTPGVAQTNDAPVRFWKVVNPMEPRRPAGS
jgi:arylsulfatase A-like enzyme